MKISSLAAVVIVMMLSTTVGAVNDEEGNSSHNSGEIISKNAKNKTPQKKVEDPSAKNITFDFPNTQLTVFAEFVARLRGKILIGEDLLKGNIDIKSQTKLSLEEVKDIFKAVLYSKGLDFSENNIYMEIIQRSDSYVKVYKINYLKSADLAKSLSQMYRMSFNVGNQPVNIQITSIDDANAIMVLAPKSQQLELEKSIKKLDVRIRQVMLNVMILEVSKMSNFGFGVDVQYHDGKYTTGVTSGGTISSSHSTSPMTFTTTGIASAGGVTYNKGNWIVDVQAVDNNTKLKILTQPKILAADNQKAEIKLGKKQPYVTTSVSIGGGTDTSSNSSTSSSISTDDIGIDIEITPRINNVKDVTLELKLKITSIVGQLKVQSGTNKTATGTKTGYNYVPQIGHRVINNTSNVKSGEVLVLGGLLKNQKTVISTAPPVLGDIPWMGWMFAKESEATEQIELMVFISPTIVYNTDESETLTKNETKKFRNYDLKEKGTIDQMLTGKKSLNDDVFNVFDYFSNAKYRSEQGFIAQPGSL
jgi:general secretion pathway protein D